MYSSLSNKRAGCNKRAGWKNLLNLAVFTDQKLFKTCLKIFLLTKQANSNKAIIFQANGKGL